MPEKQTELLGYIYQSKAKMIMLTDKEKLEIKGRLWLWESAISECQSILRLLSRNQMELDTGRPLERERALDSKFQEFAKQQSDYTPGTLKHSHIKMFYDANPKEFPCFTDCVSITKYGHMLVVVLFCQILNKGNFDEGIVAGNTKPFIAAHLNKIVDRLFSSEEEKEKFKNFQNQCLKARDQMIGHADGKAFNLKHGKVVSSMKMIASCVDDIDFDYFSDILESFRIEILKYANEVSA